MCCGQILARRLDEKERQEVQMRFAKHHVMRSLTAIATGCAAVVAVAACGGSSSSSSHAAAANTIPATSSAQPAPTTAAAATTTTNAATATTTGAPGGPTACRAGGLALTFLGGQGATGHGELGFALRNTGSQTCVTYGYPGVLFLDRGGRGLPTVPTHTTQDFFGSLPKLSLTVAPGATVSFRLGVTHGAASTAGCTTAYGLQVIPPNDTESLRTTISNGAYECQTVTVSPLQHGTTAYL
jgi:hypothetical protein